MKETKGSQNAEGEGLEAGRHMTTQTESQG